MDDDRGQTQACAACGRETRPGTRLYSDRRTTQVEGSAPIYLCGDCNERAVSHFGRQPTERDMVQIAARGAGLGWRRLTLRRMTYAGLLPTSLPRPRLSGDTVLTQPPSRREPRQAPSSPDGVLVV